MWLSPALTCALTCAMRKKKKQPNPTKTREPKHRARDCDSVFTEGQDIQNQLIPAPPCELCILVLFRSIHTIPQNGCITKSFFTTHSTSRYFTSALITVDTPPNPPTTLLAPYCCRFTTSSATLIPRLLITL